MSNYAIFIILLYIFLLTYLSYFIITTIILNLDILPIRPIIIMYVYYHYRQYCSTIKSSNHCRLHVLVVRLKSTCSCKIFIVYFIHHLYYYYERNNTDLKVMFPQFGASVFTMSLLWIFLRDMMTYYFEKQHWQQH